MRDGIPIYPHSMLNSPFGLSHNPTLCAGAVKPYLYICATKPIWSVAFLGLKCYTPHLGGHCTTIIISLHKIYI